MTQPKSRLINRNHNNNNIGLYISAAIIHHPKRSQQQVSCACGILSNIRYTYLISLAFGNRNLLIMKVLALLVVLMWVSVACVYFSVIIQYYKNTYYQLKTDSHEHVLCQPIKYTQYQQNLSLRLGFRIFGEGLTVTSQTFANVAA